MQWSTPVAAITIVGPGRPDDIDSTGGKITGSEAIGTKYMSTNGAGTGAWEWTNFGGTIGWKVTSGDTGVATLNPTNISTGAKLYFRRINDIVYFSIADPAQWGTYSVTSNATITYNDRINLGVVPTGFGSGFAQFGMITADGKEVLTKAVLNVLKRTDGGGAIQLRTPSNADALALRGKTLLRSPQLQWISAESWPTSIPNQ